jgi:hypothetical protein
LNSNNSGIGGISNGAWFRHRALLPSP